MGALSQRERDQLFNPTDQLTFDFLVLYKYPCEWYFFGVWGLCRHQCELFGVCRFKWGCTSFCSMEMLEEGSSNSQWFDRPEAMLLLNAFVQ